MRLTMEDIIKLEKSDKDNSTENITFKTIVFGGKSDKQFYEEVESLENEGFELFDANIPFGRGYVKVKDKSYIVVGCPKQNTVWLETKVQRLMDDGWNLNGNLVSSGEELFQVLIKNTIDEPVNKS